MKSEPTDERLVELSVGNQAFFAVLVSRYEDKFLRYIKRRTRVSDKDAEDILQNIFIKIYLNLNGFDPSLKFSSWGYRIAHNEIVSEHRKRLARPQHELADGDEDIFQNMASDMNIERDLIARDSRNELRNAVEKLSEKYKDIILLRFFEEQDYESISDILQMPPGTVATRLNRAKKELKALLEQQHD